MNRLHSYSLLTIFREKENVPLPVQKIQKTQSGPVRVTGNFSELPDDIEMDEFVYSVESESDTENKSDKAKKKVKKENDESSLSELSKDEGNEITEKVHNDQILKAVEEKEISTDDHEKPMILTEMNQPSSQSDENTFTTSTVVQVAQKIDAVKALSSNLPTSHTSLKQMGQDKDAPYSTNSENNSDIVTTTAEKTTSSSTIILPSRITSPLNNNNSIHQNNALALLKKDKIPTLHNNKNNLAEKKEANDIDAKIQKYLNLSDLPSLKTTKKVMAIFSLFRSFLSIRKELTLLG